MMRTKFLAHVAILNNGHVRLKWDVSASASMWSWLTNRSECPEVKRRSELTPKETESGSCRVNVPVCLAEPEESTLHQLQPRPEGLMGRTTRQGSRVRRPLSARANWSLWPGLTPSSLWRNTYTCMELLWEESSIKMPEIKEVSVVLLDQVEISQTSIATISHLQHTSPTVPPTVTVELGSRSSRSEGLDHSRRFNTAY